MRASAARPSRRRVGRLVASLLVAATAFVAQPPLQAEYADVVINNRSEKEGVRPVIFPHWFHRVRFRCKVCHFELGFKMRAGGNDIRMNDISNGRFCGVCHNGDLAWGAERCDLCHSGKPGLTTGIRGGHETMGPGRY